MSGTQGVFAEGYPGYYSDIQRVADQAAAAADEVWGGLTPPAYLWTDSFGNSGGEATDRTVTPLYGEFGTNGNALHQLVVIPSGTPGKLTVRPVRFTIGPDSLEYGSSALVATMSDSMDSALLTANGAGSTRVDLLYATVQRSVSVTGSRPIRNNSGIITQSVTLATAPSVTLTILPGTPGAGVAPALPADGVDSYNVPLAEVGADPGYASGDAIITGKIRQAWSRGGVMQEHIRPIIGGDGINSRTLVSSRLGPKLTAFCPAVHNATPQTITLITSQMYDMRQRWVRVVGTRPKLDTTFKTGEAVTAAGADTAHNGVFDSLWCHTGTDGAVFFTVTLANAGNAGAGSVKFDLSADSTTGVLKAVVTGTPYNTADNWWIVVEFTGSFKRLMVP